MDLNDAQKVVVEREKTKTRMEEEDRLHNLRVRKQEEANRRVCFDRENALVAQVEKLLSQLYDPIVVNGPVVIDELEMCGPHPEFLFFETRTHEGWFGDPDTYSYWTKGLEWSVSYPSGGCLEIRVITLKSGQKEIWVCGFCRSSVCHSDRRCQDIAELEKSLTSWLTNGSVDYDYSQTTTKGAVSSGQKRSWWKKLLGL